jgi:hypothetical protein
MASAAGGKSSFVCGWFGCERSYGTVFNLRKHQRLLGHGEMDSGNLLCIVAKCSRR